MTHLNLREIGDLRPADIVLSYESTFASWIIRKCTGSHWSHVGIYVGDGYFISAVPFHGVCKKLLPDIDKSAICRVRDINDSQRDIVVELCHEKLGIPYDFWQVFVVGYRILTHKIDSKGEDPNPNKYECSEFVAEMFSRVGINFGKFVDNVMPETIWSSPLVDRWSSGYNT